MANRYMKVTNNQGNGIKISKYHLIHFRMSLSKKQVLVRMWTKGNPCTLLEGTCLGAVTMESYKEVTQNNENRTLI